MCVRERVKTITKILMAFGLDSHDFRSLYKTAIMLAAWSISRFVADSYLVISDPVCLGFLFEMTKFASS